MRTDDNVLLGRRIMGIDPTKSLTELLGLGAEVSNCFTVHYAPTHGSWLNQAEIQKGFFRAVKDVAIVKAIVAFRVLASRLAYFHLPAVRSAAVC